MTHISPSAAKDRPLSFSQLSTFFACNFRWFLQYPLQLRTKEHSAPLEIGDAVHQGLASFLNGGDVDAGIESWYQSLLDEIPFVDPDLEANAGELRQTAYAVVERALTGLRELGFWTAFDNENKPYVEREFLLPIDTWTSGLKMVIDWLAYDPIQDQYWVVDFKTRGYFTSDEDEWANLQNALYQITALAHGINVAGTVTFQITNTPPKKPKLNKPDKNGALSMSRAAVSCDWSTYKQALIDAGLDPAHYLDMEEKLADKELVRVTTVFRSEDTLRRIWDHVIEPAVRRIATTYDYWSRYPEKVHGAMITRNLSPRTCNYCSFKTVCHNQLKGLGNRDTLEQKHDNIGPALAYFGE